MRAAAAFHLRLTRRAQRQMAKATLLDNATMISLAVAVSRALACDSPRRDQRLQTAVYCRSDKDFAAETIRAQARTHCIQGVSETSEQLKRTSAGTANFCSRFA